MQNPSGISGRVLFFDLHCGAPPSVFEREDFAFLPRHHIISVDNSSVCRIRCSHGSYSAFPPSLRVSSSILRAQTARREKKFRLASPRKDDAHALKERHYEPSSSRDRVCRTSVVHGVPRTIRSRDPAGGCWSCVGSELRHLEAHWTDGSD